MATSEQGWCREDGKGREIARIKGRPNVCVDIVKILGAARFSTRGDPFKPVNENKRRCRSSPAASSALRKLRRDFTEGKSENGE